MRPSTSKIAWLRLALASIAASGGCSRFSSSSAEGALPQQGAMLAPLGATHAALSPMARTTRIDGAATTRDLLSMLSKDCLACADKNECLSPARGGGSCEAVSGNSKISGKAETGLCLEALRCVFTSKCANTGEETPCLCGATDVLACMNGTAPPAGACIAEYKNDFGDDGKTMYDQFINKAYGAGQANALVQCVVPLCPTCRIP